MLKHRVIAVAFTHPDFIIDRLKKFNSIGVECGQGAVNLFFSVREFLKARPRLPERPTYIVFDGVYAFCRMKGYHALDFKDSQDGNSVKSLRHIPYIRLLPRRIITPCSTKPVIMQAIKNNTKDSVLQIYQQLLFNCNKEVKLQIKAVMVKLVFSTITIQEFMRQVQQLTGISLTEGKGRTPKNKSNLQAVQAFFTSARGQQFLEMFKIAETTKDKDLDDLADSYDFEVFNIRYFLKLREQLAAGSGKNKKRVNYITDGD